MGYSEREQQKLISYLNLIYHLETLSNKGNIELNMDILSSYSATMLVEAKLQELLEQGNINKEQRQYLLAKYMEVSSIGADFENSIYLLIPFLNKMETNFLTNEKSAYIFSFKDFSFDIVLKELIFKILVKTLELSDTEKIEIIILDEGTGRNNYLSDVLADLSDICNVHMFTKDLFSIKNTEKVLNQFTAKIYSKHQNMSSCQEIETLLGKVLIARYSYTETQDNRLSKNSAWDILFGRNKVEAYTINAPVWEAKYSKELINSFSPGNGIVEFMGNSSQFVL